MQHYYLDANAHTPSNLGDIESHRKIISFMASPESHGHPLAPNWIGQKASIIIEESRHKIAKCLGIKNPNCISFTSSCTEANNWATKILKTNLKYSEVYVSKYEHTSMGNCIDKFEQENILPYEIEIDKDAKIIDKDKFSDCVYIGVQSEIGIISDFEFLRNNTAGMLVCDMAQAAGKISINLEKLGIDIATFGAHKWGGPIGVGILYVKDVDKWEESGHGGSAYGRDVPGTPNVYGIYAAALALEESIKTMDKRMETCRKFKNVLESELENIGFKTIGKNANRIDNTSFIKVPGRGKGIFLLNKLSEDYHIHVGLGSACGSFYVQDSNVMKAFGINESNTSYIRISQNGDYDESDALYIVDIIKKIMRTI